MLIALIAAYFFMGGGDTSYFGERIDGLEKLIKSTIGDASRREAALRQIEVLDEAAEEINESIAVGAAKLAAVHDDYDATPRDYHEALDEIDADFNRFLKKTLDARGELRKTVTREEWAAIFVSAGNGE